jgi:hypothetical protein
MHTRQLQKISEPSSFTRLTRADAGLSPNSITLTRKNVENVVDSMVFAGQHEERGAEQVAQKRTRGEPW